MWWLDQPFGVAADVQRVVLAAHDLTRNTGESAKLFRGARRVYAGGRVNSPRSGPRRIGSGPERKTTEYADYPMPAHYPDFPSRAQMVDYLRDYTRHFELRPQIEFGAKVVLVRPRADELWDVGIGGGEQRVYKGVLVCNGHHWSKRWPDYPGRFA